MVLAHLGIFHSSSISPEFIVLGRWIFTLLPVDLTFCASTIPASAVDHRRASGPPPVSSGRGSPVFFQNQRALMTQLYGPPSSLRFCGLGRVVWFQGWRRSTGLPSGSCVTNISSSSQ